ncbi:MAG: hypothetical protein IJ328_01760 [Muribaculaceae bacterium]|nr:hypothetical protein [Muribaculaceae bacterium]
MELKLIAINDIDKKATIYINPAHIVSIDAESSNYSEIFLSNGHSIKTYDSLEEDLNIKL